MLNLICYNKIAHEGHTYCLADKPISSYIFIPFTRALSAISLARDRWKFKFD
jgi:hypothetical protein